MKLALGTVQFGLPYGIANQAGQVPRPEAKKILHLAKAHGVDTLDTAIAYGESEACLGEIGTSGFKIVTKLPAIPENISDVENWAREQLQNSLEKLKVKNVYAVLLHRSDSLAGAKGNALAKALHAIRSDGLAQKTGISIYAPDELEPAMQSGVIDLVQAPLNLVDRSLIASGWLQKLKKSGVETHTRSAFLQGLLLLQNAAIPARFHPWNELFNKWHNWLSEHKIHPMNACLAYNLSFPEIDRVVVGADNAEQLAELLDAAKTPLKAALPDISCTDPLLINPSNWNAS